MQRVDKNYKDLNSEEKVVFCIRKQKLMLVPILLNEMLRYVKSIALIGSFGIETSAAKKLTDKIIQELTGKVMERLVLSADKLQN